MLSRHFDHLSMLDPLRRAWLSEAREQLKVLAVGCAARAVPGRLAAP